MIDIYESFVCNEDIMKMCNPFALFYIIAYAKTNNRLLAVHKYQTPYMLQLNERFFKMRLDLRKHFLNNPCFTIFEGLTPAHAVDNEWVEVVAHFSEAIADHLIFIRACQVETRKGFKELFSNRLMVLRTSFEDRL